ncbi:hypothetical protein DDB_G0275137 [Dictyostelium discoideum AX4]|uniref:Uncharacterized protein DDB_G0275137 n=1 Tax=Dictyostelium discoideum TaxID=44689 RepID=Y7509_DICDI|nr:hypothetical protein DDB_G0275137 [Dictyostelium discoideum AX4]Q8T2Q8.1 RecName: Full=Uncharacterized protein DDB_G0275137 [Dictyostelium discoideum]EAL69849.1 hypothetical protein DDB_G0275137 [Dictyostelium discoideum AX4]|eukprot:XP_643717.1 hypothetical protein DDB_G0275137 [Dictyostelium discoideum AX4]
MLFKSINQVININGYNKLNNNFNHQNNDLTSISYSQNSLSSSVKASAVFTRPQMFWTNL